MADPISVQCPHCKAKLKLKAAPPAGKKIGCPKCKKPFPMKAPPKKKESDDDFLDALDDLAEDDYEAPEDEESQEDEEEAAPVRSTMRSKSGVSTKKGGKGKKGRSKKSSSGPILAIIGGSVAVLALVAGLVYLLMNLPGGGGAGGIRSASGEFIAFAPADAELFIGARPADILATPLLASFVQDPNMKPQFDEFEKMFVFPATEIDHVFVAIKVDPNAANAGRPGGPMGGNPMMGMPGGMPGMGGGNRSGIQDGVMVLRLKNPHGGKGLDQIQQQFPPKSYKEVSYHVSTVPNGPAFFFGDDRHVLLGEPTQIEKIIDRKDQSENKELLSYFAKDQHFTMTAISNGAGGSTSLPPAFSQSPQFQNLQKLTQDVSKVRLDVNMPSGVDLKVALTCKTDAAAQQILAEANKGLDGLKQQAAILKFAFPDIDSVLNTIKVNQSGTNFEGSLSVSSTVIDNLKKMANPQAGRGSPGAAGIPSGASPGALPPGFPPPGTLPPGTASPPGTLPPPLTNSPTAGQAIPESEEIKKLKARYVGFAPQIGNRPLTNDTVTFLSFFNANFAENDVDLLLAFPNLEVLEFRQSRSTITDASLVKLAKLKSLKNLKLDRQPITDAGLVAIGTLPNLETLMLEQTNVTDDGLQHLVGCPKLKWLSVVQTAATDKSIERFKKLSNLQNLFVSRTAITDAAIADFKAALPKCNVINDK